MAIIYLAAGQQFNHYSGTTRVGPSATVVDTGVDWQSISDENLAPGEFLTGEVGDVVAEGKREGSQRRESGLTFYVFMEKETGRFWYDDAFGL